MTNRPSLLDAAELIIGQVRFSDIQHYPNLYMVCPTCGRTMRMAYAGPTFVPHRIADQTGQLCKPAEMKNMDSLAKAFLMVAFIKWPAFPLFFKNGKFDVLITTEGHFAVYKFRDGGEGEILLRIDLIDMILPLKQNQWLFIAHLVKEILPDAIDLK